MRPLPSQSIQSTSLQDGLGCVRTVVGAWQRAAVSAPACFYRQSPTPSVHFVSDGSVMQGGFLDPYPSSQRSLPRSGRAA